MMIKGFHCCPWFIVCPPGSKMTKYSSSFLSLQLGFQPEVCCGQFALLKERKHISSLLPVQGLHTGNMKSVDVGGFTPKNLTKSGLLGNAGLADMVLTWRNEVPTYWYSRNPLNMKHGL